MDRSYGMKAVRDLASCRADVIAYCCTAASVVAGPGYDRRLIERIHRVTTVPATTMTTSLLAALSALGAASIVSLSPYAEDVVHAEAEFFKRAGLKVLRARGMGIRDGVLFAGPGRHEISEFARANWVTGADALVLTCANFRAHYAIVELEEELGVPVVTSTQAALWHSLRLVGVTEPILGAGKLLKTSDGLQQLADAGRMR
jgi:maleate isomerase